MGYNDPPVAGLDHHVPSSHPIFKFSANKKNGVSFLKAQSSLFYRETLEIEHDCMLLHVRR